MRRAMSSSSASAVATNRTRFPCIAIRSANALLPERAPPVIRMSLLSIQKNLPQRRNPAGVLSTPHPIPRKTQFVLMTTCPVKYKFALTAAQLSLTYGDRINVNRYCIAAVSSVKMRRVVVSGVHVYGNAIKSAEFRHCEPTLKCRLMLLASAVLPKICR